MGTLQPIVARVPLLNSQAVLKSIFLLIVGFLLLNSSSTKAAAFELIPLNQAVHDITNPESKLVTDNLNVNALKKHKLLSLLKNATAENKKVTAAILTLTLGMLGVHRIYLGTAPYIPAVYLFTFGGGFFILPIIDLVMILSTNDITKFENNKKLLMWTGE